VPGHRLVIIDMATEDAEAFVRKATEFGGILTRDDDDNPYNLPAKVEAVVARPMVACKCTQVAESRYQRRRRLKTGSTKDQAYSRGPKFGWWVCSTCNKPSRASVLHWVSSMLVGANDLLPAILGTGPAIPASLRWQRDSGVPNEDANANHFTPGRVNALDGEPTRVRRKPRRSEIARRESRYTSGGGA
jgi:hypothetical protein